MSESKESWDRFGAEMSSLGGKLREAYRTAPTDTARSELRASLKRLEEAADAFFRTVDHIAQDPEVRTSTRQAARSFGTAVGDTFRQVTDEVASKVRSRK